VEFTQLGARVVRTAEEQRDGLKFDWVCSVYSYREHVIDVLMRKRLESVEIATTAADFEKTHHRFGESPGQI
jgi:hypothetical protein